MLTFTVSVDEANAVLNALAGQPYASVAGLIGKLQAQAQEQIDAGAVGDPEPVVEDAAPDA